MTAFYKKQKRAKNLASNFLALSRFLQSPIGALLIVTR